MSPAELREIYSTAHAAAFAEVAPTERVVVADARAHIAGIVAVAAAAERRGMLRAAGIADSMADGAYIAKSIRRAAGGAE